MKVLLLNVNAIAGSTGKIVTDIKNVLEAQGNECLICYGANETIKQTGYLRICSEFERKINAAISRISGLLHGGFFPFSFYRLKKAINQWKPDIVHIHCPNGYIVDIFKTLEYLATIKQKVVLTNHAEYFYTGGCGYAYDCKKWLHGCYECNELKGYIGLDSSKYEWNKFRKSFDKFDSDRLFITSVSPWVTNRSSQSLTLGRFKNVTVLNGIETQTFQPLAVSEAVSAKLPKGKPIVLHVTASFTTNKTSIKGGFWICEAARRMPECNFIVACSYSSQIESLPPNVFIWGRTKTQKELAELYNAANLTLIASRRETFSMVVAESLCCGTPLVGFKAGGPETIALEEFTSFVDYGNVDKLVEEARIMLNKVLNKDTIASAAQKIYSKEVMTHNYIDIYCTNTNA